MADKEVVRELTATRIRLEETRARLETKIENLCREVKALTDIINKDHDTLLDHEGRICSLEDWKQRHEKQHNIYLNFRIMIFVALIGGLAGAFFSWLFSLFHL